MEGLLVLVIVTALEVSLSSSLVAPLVCAAEFPTRVEVVVLPEVGAFVPPEYRLLPVWWYLLLFPLLCLCPL